MFFFFFFMEKPHQALCPQIDFSLMSELVELNFNPTTTEKSFHKIFAKCKNSIKKCNFSTSVIQVIKCKFLTKKVRFHQLFLHFFQPRLSQSSLTFVFFSLLSSKIGFYLFAQYSIILVSCICTVPIAPCSPRGGERMNEQDLLFCDL